VTTTHTYDALVIGGGGAGMRAAISLWEKMRALGDAQPPQFLSTHPSYDTRVADLRTIAARVMPLYERARRGG